MSTLSKKEILNGNTLIAQFLGYKLIKPKDRKDPSTWKRAYWENRELHPRVLGSFNSLYFHKSWNALMPIVAKCSAINKNTFSTEFKHIWNSIFSDLSTAFLNDDIISVYNAVIRYIKEYNKLRKHYGINSK